MRCVSQHGSLLLAGCENGVIYRMIFAEGGQGEDREGLHTAGMDAALRAQLEEEGCVLLPWCELGFPLSDMCTCGTPPILCCATQSDEIFILSMDSEDHGKVLFPLSHSLLPSSPSFPLSYRVVGTLTSMEFLDQILVQQNIGGATGGAWPIALCSHQNDKILVLAPECGVLVLQVEELPETEPMEEDGIVHRGTREVDTET